MARGCFYNLLGLGAFVAGADKLLGLRSYERLFRHLGWSHCAMQKLGAAEAVGGVLVATPCTRRLGGAILAVASGTVLEAELRHREPHLALPRFLLLLAAVAAMTPKER